MPVNTNQIRKTLFKKNHFFDLGELPCFQFVEIDTAGKTGSIKVNGIVPCLLLSRFKGYYRLTECVIDNELYVRI